MPNNAVRADEPPGPDHEATPARASQPDSPDLTVMGGYPLDDWAFDVEERLASLEIRLDALIDRLAVITTGLQVDRRTEWPEGLGPPTPDNDEHAS